MTKKSTTVAIGGVVAVLTAGAVVGVYQIRKANEAARAQLIYKADGYGTFIPKPPTETRISGIKRSLPPSMESASRIGATLPSEPSDLVVARRAYAKGDYKTAATAAERVVASDENEHRPPVTGSVEVASAEHLMAFAAARQGDLKTARIRFAQARKDAQALPEPSPSPAAPGEMPQPTLAQDSAYQHAACTMGLGDKAGAERELIQFMKDFPESPLVHAAMRRIAKMHGGDIPKEAEAVWKSAQVIQRKAQDERDKQAALCGPEAVAELLKRQGKTVAVETLASEMKTGADGTSAAKLQEVMRAHGFPDAQGVRLTWAGLKQQSLSVVALVAPGHFVLVDRIGSDDSVTVWDSAPERYGATPTDSGISSPRQESQTYTLSADQWKQIWHGVALTTAKIKIVSK